MALNDLVKPTSNPTSSPRYATATKPHTAARATGRTVGTTRSQEASAASKVVERLAKPSRAPDFYLVDAEPTRHGSLPGGLSAPRPNASRPVDKQPPQMLAVTTLPKVSAPRALEASDVPGDAKALKHLQAHFNVVPVQGDAFTSLVAALFHHGVNHPESAAKLADGLQSLEEPTGEISPEAHAGFAMLKRWATALKEGQAAEASHYALSHPAVIAAITRALRGIVRHMQVFGAMKRPAQGHVGHTADLDAMQALAGTCGLKLTTHEATRAAPVDTDVTALHLLARSASGHLDVLVPKKS